MSADEKVAKLLAVVQEKRTNVQAKQKEIKKKWFTNCYFKETGENIQTASRDNVLNMLDRIVIWLITREETCKLLEIKFDRVYDGFSVHDWISDLKKRLVAIDLIKDESSLKELESRLNLLVSAEQRREIELKKIEDELGKD